MLGVLNALNVLCVLLKALVAGRRLGLSLELSLDLSSGRLRFRGLLLGGVVLNVSGLLVLLLLLHLSVLPRLIDGGVLVRDLLVGDLLLSVALLLDVVLDLTRRVREVLDRLFLFLLDLFLVFVIDRHRDRVEEGLGLGLGATVREGDEGRHLVASGGLLRDGLGVGLLVELDLGVAGHDDDLRLDELLQGLLSLRSQLLVVERQRLALALLFGVRGAGHLVVDAGRLPLLDLGSLAARVAVNFLLDLTSVSEHFIDNARLDSILFGSY